MLTGLLCAHLVAAAGALALRRVGRGTLLLCAIAPASVVVWTAAMLPEVVGRHGSVEEHVSWVPSLGLTMGLRLDAFAAVMALLVSGVGVLVFLYAYFYFAGDTDRLPPRAAALERKGLGRFAATLVVFAGAMLGIVVSDNLLALFVFWELTSVTSYLLITYQHTREQARAAGLQALLITGAGGLALLAGIVVLAQVAGTWSLSELLADPPTGPVATAGVLCVLLGAFTKSAQVPFHSWLPGAMVAPTPVSAYLHAAAMVKAGVYVVARFAPAFAAAAALWAPLVVGVGLATMLVGGYRALRQHDLKLMLAYGTVSQLGLLVVLLGIGTAAATLAGVAMLVAHGLFKASLFMVVGVVDHATGTRDIRRLSGLHRDLRPVAVTACIAAASMAGLPPLAGFIAKEAAYTALVEAGDPASIALLAGLVLGSALTVAYSFRFCWGAFADKPASDLTGEAAHPHRVTVGFWAPAALVAALSVAFGVAPWLETDLVEAATTALVPGAHPHPLALWHGVNVALGLSAVTVALGAALSVWRRRVEALQERLPSPPGSLEGYNAAVEGLRVVAARTTAIVQSGSLPVYLAVILTVAVVAPTVALLTDGTLDLSTARFADSPMQIVAVAAAIGAGVAAAASQRRFAAVLALGAVGYSVVALFAIHGAPDLALTQLLIETLGLLVFVLVLRHLPDRFSERRDRVGRRLRVGLSVAVGVFVSVSALTAASARRGGSVSGEYLARSLPEAGGRNVVNVILVDFRGLDTLGEITVLAVAGLGIAALVRAVRSGERGRDAAADTPGELPPGDETPKRARTGSV